MKNAGAPARRVTTGEECSIMILSECCRESERTETQNKKFIASLTTLQNNERLLCRYRACSNVAMGQDNRRIIFEVSTCQVFYPDKDQASAHCSIYTLVLKNWKVPLKVHDRPLFDFWLKLLKIRQPYYPRARLKRLCVCACFQVRKRKWRAARRKICAHTHTRKMKWKQWLVGPNSSGARWGSKTLFQIAKVKSKFQLYFKFISTRQCPVSKKVSSSLHLVKVELKQ